MSIARLPSHSFREGEKEKRRGGETGPLAPGLSLKVRSKWGGNTGQPASLPASLPASRLAYKTVNKAQLSSSVHGAEKGGHLWKEPPVYRVGSITYRHSKNPRKINLRSKNHCATSMHHACRCSLGFKKIQQVGFAHHLSKHMLQCSRRPQEVYLAARVVSKVAHDGHGNLVHLNACGRDHAVGARCVCFVCVCFPALPEATIHSRPPCAFPYLHGLGNAPMCG